MKRYPIRLCVVLCGLLIGSAPAQSGNASDGVLEINQACAVTTGCFAGDTPGFPVTIDGTAGRSYVLTDLLFVFDVDESAILVTTSDVSIDLGGFKISGVGCYPGGIDAWCSLSEGLGSGVVVDNRSSRRGIRVSNGSIVGMGSSGIDLGRDSAVEGVYVRGNRGVGISVGNGSTVRHVRSRWNGGIGIFGSDAVVVTESVVAANRTVGIDVGGGSHVAHNAIWGNGEDGVSFSAGTVVEENLVRSNRANPLASTILPGIGGLGGIVTGNVVVTIGDAKRGIWTTGSSLVNSNVVWNTTGGAQIVLSSDSAYRGNVLGTTSTVATGINLGANSCGTSVCP